MAERTQEKQSVAPAVGNSGDGQKLSADLQPSGQDNRSVQLPPGFPRDTGKDDRQVDGEHEETLTALETLGELSPVERKAENLRSRMIELVADSLEVVHSAVKGCTWQGKKVTRNQIMAAAPIVAKFAPSLDQVGHGDVHLHLNIPRPALAAKKAEIIDLKTRN